MRDSIKFIHAADLHLDSPFVGLKHLPPELLEKMRESTFLAFSRLVTFAINKRVDFILLSGDLYDEEDRSLKAQLKLKKEFERLANANIEVYVIHGNHDHMGGNWIELSWPENIHIFSSEQVEMKIFEKNEQPLAYIYGYSYPSRSVRENITAKYQKVDNSSVYHIGMLHGSIEGNDEHDVYCPFKLTELIEKKFDYWALGHIHKRQLLHEDPVIAYPGNIQGRHRKEAGEKGFYFVDMKEDAPNLTFVSVEEVIWDKIQISIDTLTTMTDLLHECRLSIEQLRQRGKPTLLTIEFIGTGNLAANLHSHETLQDMMDDLNEEEHSNQPVIWIYKMTNQTYLYEENTKLESFFNDLHESVEQYDAFNDVLQPLMSHPLYRRYIDEFTSEEQQQLLKEAEKLLRQEILLQSEVK